MGLHTPSLGFKNVLMLHGPPVSLVWVSLGLLKFNGTPSSLIVAS